MTGASIISVQAVAKRSPIYARPTDMLKEALLGGKRHDVFGLCGATSPCR